MAFRDDRDALLARTAALEGEVERLRRERDAAEAARREAEAARDAATDAVDRAPAPAPPAPPPTRHATDPGTPAPGGWPSPFPLAMFAAACLLYVAAAGLHVYASATGEGLSPIVVLLAPAWVLLLACPSKRDPGRWREARWWVWPIGALHLIQVPALAVLGAPTAALRTAAALAILFAAALIAWYGHGPRR